MPALGLDLPAQAGRWRAAAAFDFAGGVLPPGATLARASAAVRHAPNGVLTTEAANVARFDHDPTGHALRGLLLEEARSNDFSYSDALDQPAWTKLAGTVTPDTVIAPDGGSGGDVFVPTAASAAHVVQRAITVTAGTAYTLSAYCRPAGRSFVQLYAGSGYGSFYLNVDLAAAAESAFAPGTSVVLSRSVTALDNGWCRIAVALTALASGSVTVVLAPQPSGSAARAAGNTGDGTSGVAVWGLQHEAGGIATSYVATGTATATRAADVLALDWGSRGVADGATTVRYTFDDGTTQDLPATVSGGSAIVPTTLARRWLRRAEKL